MGEKSRELMAKRVAMEISSGMVINLGIGIPSLVPNYLQTEHVMFQAENGILGMGPRPNSGEEDENLCNAGGFPVTIMNGASYCDSATAFAMIRSGKIDMTILGALQVSRKGDLANWIVPGKKVPGMGGAMELAQKAKRVIVLMSHTDKAGKPKIVESCQLPLTATKCVDMIITEMAVFHIQNEILQLSELFAPYTVEDVVKKTGCLFSIENKIKIHSV
nr:3-oxoacid CoA-transferase subunit B [Bacillus sp. DNRA2]